MSVAFLDHTHLLISNHIKSYCVQNETISVNVTAGGGEERHYFTCHEAILTDMTY